MNRKKVIIVLLCLTFLLLGCSCSRGVYQIPWDQFCYSLGKNQEISLGKEEKEYIINLLNIGEWENDITDCTCDFVFYTQSQTVKYHSECGTFNDITNHKHLKLNEEECRKINAMLN